MTNQIRILTDSEIASIAAGEVIESPASIFKELLENSIDAQSTEITIRYENNGLESIIISDNGCGVSKEDLPKMFIPHATSKLSSVNDIYYHNDRFFGFRGEALAAISGVSQTTIITRQKKSDIAHTLTYHHGKMQGEITITAGNIGTTVLVTNLFDQIPARKKYLQSVKNLEKEIRYILTAIVIVNPHITFTIYKDGKLDKQQYITPSMQERMYSVASQNKENFLPINYTDKYVSVHGIISASEYGWYDKSKIFLFVNHRIIKQPKLILRCTKPYYAENFIKRYPELYLHISVNPEQVDVNIHPRKEEVLFLYQQKIESILESIITKTLAENSQAILKINHACTPPALCVLNHNTQESTPVPATNLESEKEKSVILSFQSNQKNSSKNLGPMGGIKKDAHWSNQIIAQSISDTLSCPEYNLYNMPVTPSASPQPSLFADSQKNETEYEKYLGILDHTYILILKAKSILCIDQHALHEKILYEKYMRKMDALDWFMHPLLIPYTIKKKFNEIALLKRYDQIFKSCGFLLDYTDENIIIHSTPQIILDRYEVILDIYLTKFLELKDEPHEQDIRKIIMHEIFATKACKNAIKAGDILNEETINILLSEIKNYNVSFCPHGRPTYYEITSNMLATLCKRK